MDRVLAVALVAVAQLQVWADGGSVPGRLASALAALSVAAVAWRRRSPVVGLTVLMGALAVDAGSTGHFTHAFLPAFAALLLLTFSVGERGGWSSALSACAVVAAGLAAVQVLQPDPRYSVASQIGFFGVAGVLLPMAAGHALTVHRRRSGSLAAVRDELAERRAARLDAAAEDERARLAAALSAFASSDVQDLASAVARVRSGKEAAAVAALARKLLARLREDIGRLHEAPREPGGSAELEELSRRVAALETGRPASPDEAAAGRRRPVRDAVRRHTGVLLAVGAFAVGLTDILLEVRPAPPVVPLLVGLTAVSVPLVFHRRAPLLVTAIEVIALTAFSGLVTPVAPLLAGNLVLLLPYGCGRRGGWRGAAAGVVMCGIGAVAIPAVAGGDMSANDWPTTALLVLAAALAGVLRGREVRLAEDLRAASADLLVEQRRAEDLVRLGRRLELARDLHDAVAHGLTVVALQAAAAARVWDGDPSRAAEHLSALRGTTGETLAELGRLAGALTDGAPDGPALADVDALVARARAAGIPVDLAIDGEAAAVPPDVQATAYRVVQECLTNAADHGAGQPVTVRLHAADRRVEIAVSNPVEEAALVGAGPSPMRGRGLANLTQRVEASGGSFTAGVDGGRFVVSATVGGDR